MRLNPHPKFASVFLLPVLAALGFQSLFSQSVENDADTLTATTEIYRLIVEKDGFRYRFERPDGTVIADAHPESGLQIGADPESLAGVAGATFAGEEDGRLRFQVETADGETADVTIDLQPHWAKFSVTPRSGGKRAIAGRTAGISPAFGLADHAAIQDDPAYSRPPRSSPELTGFRSDELTTSLPRRPYGRGIRIGTNFVIFPQHNFATLNVEPMAKIVRVTEEEHAQGVAAGTEMPALYYFFGSPERIYRSLHEVREAEGYPFMKPKYAFFGVGWEAWGALAWDTNAKTVRDNVQRYLDLGFPLEWMVIGSGFWPREKGDEYIATTSFGMWDEELYPNPRELIDDFREQGLKVFLGLRITFTADGPYSEEGLASGYFMKDETGEARIFDTNFPSGYIYLLDTQNPEAVAWYVDLCGKWMEAGVEGFKEDFMDRPAGLRDDIVDPVNEALMENGVYIMGRNTYLGSPADLHRFDDFNANQKQDRGPINGLSLAYSGHPYVYPDVLGGTQQYVLRLPEEQAALYMMRFAQYSALNPGMAMGFGPWNLDRPDVVEVVRDAARLHRRLRPYTYSYAVKTFHTGFPWPLLPLPLAYPDDAEVYRLANDTRRSYQWMIGEALLATPLYGDDYATADSRDVYLPEGTWIEYDNGNVHEGPVTLTDYPLPVGKTPLFVGGTGIVVEEIDGKPVARIYPVADEAEMVFYGADGEPRNEIAIRNPDWEEPTVVDSETGREIESEWSRHALEFPLIPGRDYRVE